MYDVLQGRTLKIVFSILRALSLLVRDGNNKIGFIWY